jgi:hypothetical protein
MIKFSKTNMYVIYSDYFDVSVLNSNGGELDFLARVSIFQIFPLNGLYRLNIYIYIFFLYKKILHAYARRVYSTHTHNVRIFKII